MKYWSIWDYLLPIIFFICGIIIGLNFPSNTKPSKHYPIEVKLHWETGQSGGYPTMDADSVKGDTVYKDGNLIVVKNIINIQFK
mgnify:CR=1 FL=1